MGAVEFFFPEKGIDLLRREDLPQPALKHALIGDRPVCLLHLAASSEPGCFPDTEMHIGMAFLVGHPHDRFQARGSVHGRRRCARGGRRPRREAGRKDGLGHDNTVPVSQGCRQTPVRSARTFDRHG